MSLSLCFQDVDFARLRPIRYTKMNHCIYRLYVSGSWLMVTNRDSHIVSLYGLPGLELHNQLTVPDCCLPRADSDRVIYAKKSHADLIPWVKA